LNSGVYRGVRETPKLDVAIFSTMPMPDKTIAMMKKNNSVQRSKNFPVSHLTGEGNATH
jgi:hypothetical protein